MNHVLVVDDSPVDRRLAGRLLERPGRYHVEYASDGLEALEHLEDSLPLAVVTDLQMPGMDGLALVRAAHRRYPNVPLILMTAHGSEELALAALLHGAADYVPKCRLVADLPAAVDGVLAAAAGTRGHERLAPCLRAMEFRYELENDPRLIADLVAEVQVAAGGLGVAVGPERVRLGKAVEEALLNAMLHGNLELTCDEIRAAGAAARSNAECFAERRSAPSYCERRVRVHAVLTAAEAQITVRDDGPGFDHAALPDVRADPSHLTGGAGRGLVLIRAFTDEAVFNAAGNELRLVKRRRGPGG
jgi:CheY-like chemotaxis protein/anti-sigma regulatory factor (Ser/Thr protein kinase)